MLQLGSISTLKGTTPSSFRFRANLCFFQISEGFFAIQNGANEGEYMILADNILYIFISSWFALT